MKRLWKFIFLGFLVLVVSCFVVYKLYKYQALVKKILAVDIINSYTSDDGGVSGGGGDYGGDDGDDGDRQDFCGGDPQCEYDTYSSWQQAHNAWQLCGGTSDCGPEPRYAPGCVGAILNKVINCAFFELSPCFVGANDRSPLLVTRKTRCFAQQDTRRCYKTAVCARVEYNLAGQDF